MPSQPGYGRPPQVSRNPFGDPQVYSHPRRDYGSESDHADLYGSTTRLTSVQNEQTGLFQF
jgi:hypothetical protein